MKLEIQPEYIIYTCSNCKTILALEKKAPKHNFCPHIIKLKPKIKCGVELPNQKQRDILYKQQFRFCQL